MVDKEQLEELDAFCQQAAGTHTIDGAFSAPGNCTGDCEKKHTRDCKYKYTRNCKYKQNGDCKYTHSNNELKKEVLRS